MSPPTISRLAVHERPGADRPDGAERAGQAVAGQIQGSRGAAGCTSPQITCIVSYSSSRRRASRSSSAAAFAGSANPVGVVNGCRGSAGNRVAADVLEVVAGGLHEAQEQERAVAGRLALAIPLGQDLGGFLRLRAAVLPRGGDEIVDEVIGDLAARRQLHLLEIARA